MNYVCSICGKSNVKLWRPCSMVYPLICAQCAEDHQISRTCHNIELNDKPTIAGYYVGIKTSNGISLPDWQVNEYGCISSGKFSDSDGSPVFETNLLPVNLSEIADDISSNITLLMPAYPTKDGTFWGYPSAPKDVITWWQKLPTKIN